VSLGFGDVTAFLNTWVMSELGEKSVNMQIKPLGLEALKLVFGGGEGI
jgi:hypothetical protein